MDSLSQLALGAAVGVAVMGRRTAVWKAALWGGLCGTLPDLDALVSYGDPVSDMTLHRADSHALFWLTLGSPAVGWLASRVHREVAFRRWWLLAFLALVTHPLLDLMTVYGTQLLRPFDTTPYGVGSIFIIDPLYTLPLLAGLVGASFGRLRWNAAGLLLSTAYLAWGVAVQQHVASLARASLAERGVAVQRLLVTPTAFNTVLWRIVAVDGEAFHEGFHSLLDDTNQIAFDRFPLGTEYRAPLAAHPPVQRMAWFTHGFYKLQREGDVVHLSDLRMGQEPNFVFRFSVARVEGGQVVPVPAGDGFGSRGDVRAGLAWLWRRIGGEPVPPPR